MIRISMKFTTIQPFLRVLEGYVHVEEVDEHILSKAPIEILTCKVRKTEGTIGYSSINQHFGIPSKLFETVRPIIDTMVKSYWNGMILEENIYQWVFMDESDDSWANVARIPEETKAFIDKTIEGNKIKQTFKEVVKSGIESI